MQDSLITRGLELMLFGMGTVVVFLTALVFVTAAMSALVRRYLPPPPEPGPAGGAAPGRAAPGRAAPDARLIAVISAAIHRHRNPESKREGTS